MGRYLSVALALGSMGCVLNQGGLRSDPPRPDAGARDAGLLGRPDSAIADAGVRDGGAPPLPDAGFDAGTPCTNPRFERCNARDDDCDGAIDEDEICGCPAVQYNGHSYLFCANGAAWSQAHSACILSGGTFSFSYGLTIIEDASENAFLAAEAGRRGLSPWIGLSDTLDEGNFRWANGNALGYASWDTGYPRNNHFANCVFLNRLQGGRWQDEICSFPMPFICESD